MNMMLDAATAWFEAGCSVGRARTDGSKAAVGLWKEFQERRASIAELSSWFQDGYPGIGVFTGKVSGDLEMYELEGRAVQEGVLEQVIAAVPAELWQRLTTGYLEFSAGGGIHIFYRVEGGVAGNTKLAQRPARDDELTADEQLLLETKGKRAVRALIETRGEAGWCVVAPSHGPVHPNGKAWQTACDPRNIPTITAAERDLLHAISRSLDQMPPPAPIPERTKPAGVSSSGDLTPGEDFNIRGDWREILEPHGWQVAYMSGSKTFWRRPGKSLGVSAVTGGDQGDYFWAWTTSSEIPSEEPFAKWRVFALLEYGGNFSAAAAELRRRGYGTDRPLPAHEELNPSDFGFLSEEVVRPKDETVPASEAAPSEEPGRFEKNLIDRDGLANLPQPSPLIEDTIDLGTVAMLVGHRGSYKSFLALDWAGSVATGRRWQGRDVVPGSVLYIAAEGAFGLHGRLKAWEDVGGGAVEADKFFVLNDAPNLGRGADVDEICAMVIKRGFKLVVVDTFAKCIIGLDENSSRDTGVAVRGLYRIQAATDGGTVIALHHTGKDGLTTRGSSALEAGVDTVYLTQKEAEGYMKLSRTKRKEGPAEDEIDFKFMPMGESGYLDRNSDADAALEKRMKFIMDEYEECFLPIGYGASKKDLLDVTQMPFAHFYRALNALVRDGILIQIGDERHTRYKSRSEF